MGIELTAGAESPDQQPPGCRPGLGNAIGAYRPLLARWLLQMALDLDWYRKPASARLPGALVSRGFIAVTGVAIDAPVDDEGELVPSGSHAAIVSDQQLADLLEARLAQLRTEEAAESLPLLANIQVLGEMLQLTAAERAVVTFAAALEGFTAFRQAISAGNQEVDTRHLAAIIARLADLPETHTLKALRDDHTLLSTGVVQTEVGTAALECKCWLWTGLADTLLLPDMERRQLVAHFMQPAAAPDLPSEAFRHLARDVDVVKAYLRQVVRQREPGANILFHGAPGTGKTELAKVVAQALGLELFEVPYAQDNGRPLTGELRLRAYSLCQTLASHMRDTVLLFDEVEDVFATGFGNGRRSPGGKAWVNRALERNPVPAIWITNDTDIDPAFLRRFDYSVRFAVPPRSARIEMARHHLREFAPTEAWLSTIASNEQVTPAQLVSAARLARLAAGTPLDACGLVERALDRSASLLGQPRMSLRPGPGLEYDLDMLNADTDVSKLVEGIRHRPTGSFCFFGPPGTGKSELGRHLARSIGRPVLLRRASDILSRWIGGTERNIAWMFEEATASESVLILDEADSFLADRRDAQQSWEVTQVNELLTQMEAFAGIFICTTNLMDRLDPASLRRFVFKVKFDYLDADQRWRLFRRELARLGGDASAAIAAEAQVRALDHLTPGDFAVVARRLQFVQEVPTADRLVAELRAECVAKGAPPGRMGFQA